ncbi:hypothetical protein [Odoribacter laneus]|uniref:hypothetical protein n=2 Tax=Odoribacter laneus TaxID=626933 RepID=UPI00033EB9EB|nr:hypothetical protein [Odoribacter laneus]CCZ81542.1 putative uncharacterized protein [Odoribacter laneus CAG:561]
MKTKFFSVLILISLIVMPVFSSMYYTDEQIEYHGSDDGDYIYPTDTAPIYLEGILSQDKMTIVNTFYYDLGQVTFKIESQQAKSIVLTENTIAYKGGTYTLDIRNLEAGSYKISCYSEELATQVAKFEIKK